MFKTLLAVLTAYLTGPDFRDALIRSARTFGYAFAAVLVPGLFGWLHAVTEWAQAQGQVPFPDATSLAYVGVSAVVAGAIAVVNLLGIVVEDATGRAPGRRQ